MERYDHSTTVDILGLLNRLAHCSPPISEAWVRELLQLAELAQHDDKLLRSRLNSKRIWGGAESLAAEALNDSGALAESEWQMRVREFRDLMIQLGELLQSQDQAYPDIQSWLLAFHNWNSANV